ncbi:Dirigent protein 23 [Forsythia ovata]|uniref:Dirigent protein n=1 Tax=Forsythia ovata TaxID=205694 RepID=A0ABD1TPG2_9LAMI
MGQLTFRLKKLYRGYFRGNSKEANDKNEPSPFLLPRHNQRENPNVVKIIRGNELGFGTTYMIDDVLTEGPNRNSKLIGRAQGMYSLASQHDLGLLMVVNFVFTDGKYNGNSLSMLGNDHVLENVREMPIVGGSGIFRLAKGYALAHTIWFDQKTGDAIVEYNVTVQHF